MDREQARFILRSFRPDGTDEDNPDFGEALAVALEDRELGAWLAAERTQDAFYVAALSDLVAPSTLQAEILERIKNDPRQKRPTEAESEDEPKVIVFDPPRIDLAAEAPRPATRQHEALTVLKVETRVGAGEPMLARPGEGQENTRSPSWWKTATVSVALVLGAFAAFELTSTSRGSADAGEGSVALSKLEHRAIKEVAHPVNFSLRSSDLRDHRAWLLRNRAPAFDPGEIPDQMAAARAVGCRIFMMGQTRISLVCLEREGQPVHLVVMGAEDLKPEDLQKLRNGRSECWQCPATKVSVAAWEDSGQVYLLLGKMEEKDLLGLRGRSPTD
ncbi:MAG: hypothetical protein CMO40_02505 [Verrucomicrobiaceae bacterium]|nr:hypothetical protein [Verrucomicrobiaceae bacterium]